MFQLENVTNMGGRETTPYGIRKWIEGRSSGVLSFKVMLEVLENIGMAL